MWGKKVAEERKFNLIYSVWIFIRRQLCNKKSCKMRSSKNRNWNLFFLTCERQLSRLIHCSWLEINNSNCFMWKRSSKWVILWWYFSAFGKRFSWFNLKRFQIFSAKILFFKHEIILYLLENHYYYWLCICCKNFGVVSRKPLRLNRADKQFNPQTLRMLSLTLFAPQICQLLGNDCKLWVFSFTYNSR